MQRSRAWCGTPPILGEPLAETRHLRAWGSWTCICSGTGMAGGVGSSKLVHASQVPLAWVAHISYFPHSTQRHSRSAGTTVQPLMPHCKYEVMFLNK